MKQDLIPVRRSHLLRHISVGAIMRGPDCLLSIKDIRYWTDKNGQVAATPIHYVDHVRNALDILQELREPPVAKELDTGHVDGMCVPAMRFPRWALCVNPKCGLLYFQPWRSQEDAVLRCSACRGNLEQVSYVLVHPDGRMCDVPWHYLAHSEHKTQTQRQCGRDWKVPYLHLTYSDSRRILTCSRCHARVVLDDSHRIMYGTERPQPWIEETLPNVINREDSEPAVLLEVNDARVHSPVTCNALVIPPESRIRKGTVVDRLYRNPQKLRLIEKARNPLSRSGYVRSIAAEFRCSPGDIENAWKDIQNGYPLYGESVTAGLLLESEYKALLDELPDMFEDEDFVNRNLSQRWKGLEPGLPLWSRAKAIVNVVSQLVAVERLKEIQVLKGFQRLGGKIVPPDIIGTSTWLPAIELYGEGLFFTLDEATLSRWDADPNLAKRTQSFHKRFITGGMKLNSDVRISPRFLLLHTLAHLLIRQLESTSGYPAASIKERIYCSASSMQMSGILVYVAVPDAVGSLGGLSELAEPKRFLSLLCSVFDHAEWCSLDPVCSEHEGQGPGLLNRAACHACALLPEPSCAYSNILLDRMFVKGDPQAEFASFLEFASKVQS